MNIILKIRLFFFFLIIQRWTNFIIEVPEAYTFMYNFPEHSDLLNECLQEVQKQIIDNNTDESVKFYKKDKVFARVHSLPDGLIVRFPNSSQANELIYFNGTVTKVSSPKMIETIQRYLCIKCGKETIVKLDLNIYDLFEKPNQCSNSSCSSDKFRLANNSQSKIYSLVLSFDYLALF
jgi:DNA replicative helicase MCM subunit Mcm2 (Cdc46/Mcm family)